jgi:SlyX protein
MDAYLKHVRHSFLFCGKAIVGVGVGPKVDRGQAVEIASNRGMAPSDDTDKRLTDLEVKASFTEDLLDHLNLTIVRQQQQIERLLREVAELRQRQPDEGTAPFRSLRDELPPHY